MSEAMAEAVAGALLAAGCLKVRVDPPFRLVSGLLAPFYVDCRQVLGDPAARGVIADRLAERARTLPAFDVIAGGVTAGVPFATLLADRLGAPLAYVRGEAKAHGLGAQVEGAAVEGRRVLLVEDLMTTGDSSLKFLRILRDHGAVVGRGLVVIDRSRDGNTERLAAEGMTVDRLATVDALLREAEAAGMVDAPAMAEIRAFLADPAGWSARHDG
jgi:orotate phosphoribosyltransferase